MKLSRCHSAKMLKNSSGTYYICSFCGYPSSCVEVEAKDYRRKALAHTFVYSPKNPALAPPVEDIPAPIC